MYNTEVHERCCINLSSGVKSLHVILGREVKYKKCIDIHNGIT